MNAIRLALSAASLLLIGCGGGHPSDDSLRSRLFSHRLSFTKLVQMANRDPNAVRIDPAFTIPDRALSQTRWAEYRSLFRELGLEYGISRPEKDVVLMPFSATGLFGGRGTTKGYAYSAEHLKSVAGSLNDQAAIPCSGIKHCIVYKYIEENWYIFFEKGS
jgi:hypothetical protein